MAITVTASLNHIFLPKNSKEQAEHKKTYQPIIKLKDEKDRALTDSLKVVTQERLKLNPNDKYALWIKNNFIKGIENNLSVKNSSLNAYHKRKKELNSKYSVFNHRNIRQFSYNFGTRLFGIVAILMIIIIGFTKDKHLKRFIVKTSLISLTPVAMYYMIWVFYNNLFNDWYYMVLMGVVSIMCGILSVDYYRYIDNKKTRIEKLLVNIRDAVGFMLKNTRKDKEDEKWELLDKISKN